VDIFNPPYRIYSLNFRTFSMAQLLGLLRSSQSRRALFLPTWHHQRLLDTCGLIPSMKN